MKNRLNFMSSILLTEIEKKAFIYIFIISAISLFSLIQANVLYIDDIGRVLSGNTLWAKDGRPLSSLATQLIQLGKPLTDISPLTQILSVALYSLSAIYLGKVFRVNNLVFLSLGGIAFVLNPFNLQNFSYIFDSFTMGLAVFSSTIAFFMTSLFLEKKLSNPDKFFLFSLILLLLIASLCLYQAATSIYIAAFTFYSLLKLVRDEKLRESVKFFIFSIIILLFSLLGYTPIKNFYVKSNYGLERSQIPPMEDLPEIFIKNLLYSLKRLHESLGGGTLSFLIFALSITVILSFILLAFKNFFQNKSSNLMKLFLTICLTLFYIFSLTVSFYGLSLIFIDPVWQPRTFMGFSAVIGISCFYLGHLFYPARFLRYFLIFFLCLLCVAFANLSLTFGNTLHYQNTQEEIIATVLLSDLEEEISKLYHSPAQPKIVMAGQLKPSALTSQAFRKYPILKIITQPYFKQSWTHGYGKLKSLEFQFDLDFKLIKKITPTKEKKFVSSSPPILSRRIYDIYFEDGDTFVILFKE